jgi:transposase-like protein
MKKTATQQHRGEQQTLFGTKRTPLPKGNACHIVSVGKRRDGGTRYWCLKHRSNATAKYGKPATACRTAHFPPIAEQDILTLDFRKYPGGVALWGAVPAVYDTTTQPLDRGIHVHSRATPESEKDLDKTFRAVRIVGKDLPAEGLYVDELDAIYYMATTVFGYTMREVRCTYCGYSHLDRDWFSVHPHSRHLCAGCGKHFKDPQTGIGNPICGVREACGVQSRTPKTSTKKLKIKQQDYPGGIQIWGSNPAFIWTSKSTEEEGIHVHAYKEGAQWPETDETYGSVTIDGITLDPVMVRLYMAQAILPSLKDRITTVHCPTCDEGILSEGDLAFTPATTQRCATCERDVPTAGRLRKVVSNPLPLVLEQLERFAAGPLQKHDLGLLSETI